MATIFSLYLLGIHLVLYSGLLHFIPASPRSRCFSPLCLPPPSAPPCPLPLAAAASRAIEIADREHPDKREGFSYSPSTCTVAFRDDLMELCLSLAPRRAVLGGPPSKGWRFNKESFPVVRRWLESLRIVENSVRGDVRFSSSFADIEMLRYMARLLISWMGVSGCHLLPLIFLRERSVVCTCRILGRFARRFGTARFPRKFLLDPRDAGKSRFDEVP